VRETHRRSLHRGTWLGLAALLVVVTGVATATIGYTTLHATPEIHNGMDDFRSPRTPSERRAAAVARAFGDAALASGSADVCRISRGQAAKALHCEAHGASHARLAFFTPSPGYSRHLQVVPHATPGRVVVTVQGRDHTAVELTIDRAGHVRNLTRGAYL
jgi:hypothetical protein